MTSPCHVADHDADPGEISPGNHRHCLHCGASMSTEAFQRVQAAGAFDRRPGTHVHSISLPRDLDPARRALGAM